MEPYAGAAHACGDGPHLVGRERGEVQLAVDLARGLSVLRRLASAAAAQRDHRDDHRDRRHESSLQHLSNPIAHLRPGLEFYPFVPAANSSTTPSRRPPL